MSPEVIGAFIAILPQLVLLMIGSVLVVQHRFALAHWIDTRVTGLSAFGLRIDLKPSDVEAAVRDRLGAQALTTSRQGSISDGKRTVERARRLGPYLLGRTVLWVDDQPTNNRVERRLLREIGVFTESVTTNEDALRAIRDPSERIDAVISDVRRPDGTSGWRALAEEVERLDRPIPVILYIMHLDRSRGTPAGALGITNRPDELLDLVMDALDRAPQQGPSRVGQ